MAGYSLKTPPQVVSVTYPAADITHESCKSRHHPRRYIAMEADPYTFAADFSPVPFPNVIEVESVEQHLRPDGPVVSHAVSQPSPPHLGSIPSPAQQPS